MGLPEDEQDLIAAAKGGDMLAFGELVRRHQRAALRVAAVAGADAEDAAQEMFDRPVSLPSSCARIGRVQKAGRGARPGSA
jgi:DNA-directed RNA polymerase specialized sigma24 family protein